MSEIHINEQRCEINVHTVDQMKTSDYKLQHVNIFNDQTQDFMTFVDGVKFLEMQTLIDNFGL